MRMLPMGKCCQFQFPMIHWKLALVIGNIFTLATFFGATAAETRKIRNQNPRLKRRDEQQQHNREQENEETGNCIRGGGIGCGLFSR